MRKADTTVMASSVTLAVSANFRVCFRRGPVRLMPRSTGRVATSVLIGSSLAALVDPRAGGLEENDRETEDDDEQQPGQGGRVSHVEEAERLAGEVQVQEQRRLVRGAAAGADPGRPRGG